MNDFDAFIAKWWGRFAVVAVAATLSHLLRRSSTDWVQACAFVPAFVGGIVYARWVWSPTDGP